MNSAVVVFPASNCDRDAAVALDSTAIMRKARLLAFVFSLAAISVAAFAQEDNSAKREAAREALIAHNDALHINTDFEFIAETYVQRMHESHPELSAGQLHSLHDLILRDLGKHRDAYFKAQIRIYAEHYTLKELRAVAAFYKSRIGKRMETENAAIVPELGKVLNDIEHAAIRDATRELNSGSIK